MVFLCSSPDWKVRFLDYILLASPRHGASGRCLVLYPGTEFASNELIRSIAPPDIAHSNERRINQSITQCSRLISQPVPSGL